MRGIVSVIRTEPNGVRPHTAGNLACCLEQSGRDSLSPERLVGVDIIHVHVALPSRMDVTDRVQCSGQPPIRMDMR